MVKVGQTDTSNKKHTPVSFLELSKYTPMILLATYPLFSFVIGPLLHQFSLSWLPRVLVFLAFVTAFNLPLFARFPLFNRWEPYRCTDVISMRVFEAKASKSRENDYSVMNWVMRRFRPIAPKPEAGAQPTSGAVDPKNSVKTTARRTKRRYVRGRQKKQLPITKSRDGEKSGVEDESPEKDKVTLQLLPAPERSENDHCFGTKNIQKTQENGSIFMDRDPDLLTKSCNGIINHKASDSRAASVTETWIIVEHVTHAYADSAVGVGLGFSDREKIDNLEIDSCPGFFSDCTNKVVWLNKACRKMIQDGEEDAAAVHAVRLVVREKLPYYWPSFACRVRLMQQGPKRSTTVACDAWRMENAGFAWKLDVTTALGLRSFQ